MAGHTGSKHASVSQIIAIGKRLDISCRKTPEGFAEYINGDSDDRVARDIGVSKSSVARVRLDTIGKFKHERAAKEIGELKSHNIQLASQLQATQNQLQELIIKHNNLCAELALNQVLRTAKHHEIKLPPRGNGMHA